MQVEFTSTSLLGSGWPGAVGEGKGSFYFQLFSSRVKMEVCGDHDPYEQRGERIQSRWTLNLTILLY